MSIFHVIYLSTATIPLSSSQLRDLLTDARQRNLDLELTGLLLYAHGRFMQVLEGPESAVRTVFDSIQRDERHKNVETIRLEEKESRHFPDWRMGFRNFTVSIETLPVISRFLEPDFDLSAFQGDSKDYRMLLAFRQTIDP